MRRRGKKRGYLIYIVFWKCMRKVTNENYVMPMLIFGKCPLGYKTLRGEVCFTTIGRKEARLDAHSYYILPEML